MSALPAHDRAARRSRLESRTAKCLLTTLGCTLLAQAGQAYLVGADTAVSTELQSQRRPALAYSASRDEFLLVYVSQSSPAQVRGRRLAGTGFPLGPSFQLGLGNPNSRPAVAYSATSDVFLVVWELRVDDDELFDEIYGIRVLGGEDGTFGAQINVATVVEPQRNPALAWDAAADRFLIVWEDLRSPPQRSIFGRRLNASGSGVGGLIEVLVGTAEFPAVEYEPIHGAFLVAWRNIGLGPTAGHSAQRVASSGALIGGRIDLSLGGPVQPGWIALAYGTTTGEILAVYQRSGGMYTRRVTVAPGMGDGGGELVGPEVVVGLAGAGSRPTVARAGTPVDHWVAVWDGAPGAPATMRAAWIGSTGDALFGDFPVRRSAESLTVGVRTSGPDEIQVVYADVTPMSFTDLYVRRLDQLLLAPADAWSDDLDFLRTQVLGGTWNLFAIRPEPASDPALQLFPEVFFYLLPSETSNDPSFGEPEMIAVDGARTGSGNFNLLVDHFAAGAHAYRAGRAVALVILSLGASWAASLDAAGTFVQAYGIAAPAGEPLQVELVPTSGTADFGLAVFRSTCSSSTWYQDRSEALAVADVNPAGAGETLTFSVPADATLGLAV